MSCPPDKWLSHSLGDLHLHPWPHESQSRVQRCDVPTPAKDNPPLQKPMEEHLPKRWMKKQVRFEKDEDLGDDPTLPTDLTAFLAGGTAEE